MTTAKQELAAMDKRIATLKKERKELERELRKTSRECIDSVPPQYSYEVFECKGIMDDHDGIRIQRTLDNAHEYDAIINEYGYPTFNGFEAEDNRKVLSVAYKRNEYGVLTHGGGGWLLLKDGRPLSNSEWELLKQGNQGIIQRLLKD